MVVQTVRATEHEKLHAGSLTHIPYNTDTDITSNFMRHVRPHAPADKHTCVHTSLQHAQSVHTGFQTLSACPKITQPAFR
jgi:hypothetical protein